jgi:hypothetical protein
LDGHRETGHYGFQLLWDTARVGEIGDDEAGHVCEQRDCLRDVSTLRPLEVEQDWQVIAPSQLIPQCVEDRFALRCEAANDQYRLGGDGSDDVADFLIV